MEKGEKKKRRESKSVMFDCHHIYFIDHFVVVNQSFASNLRNKLHWSLILRRGNEAGQSGNDDEELSVKSKKRYQMAWRKVYITWFIQKY